MSSSIKPWPRERQATDAAVDSLISSAKEEVVGNPVKQAAAATFMPGKPTGETSKPPQTEEELQAAIKKQVEYYFSDANLKNDKFLRIEQSKNDGKWIDISCIATFNRMKTLNPSLKTEVIAKALDGCERPLPLSSHPPSMRARRLSGRLCGSTARREFESPRPTHR